MPADTVEEIPRLIKDCRHRQYIPGDKLGKGGFATCWASRQLCRREPVESSECALKVVKAHGMPTHLAKRFRIELEIHSKLKHPNVVDFYRAFTYHDLTYVALEICHNGSLADMVKRRKYLTMGEIRRFLIQLCGAVKYLHKRDVVHRDIKAGNIFLDRDLNVKLGDFGLAAVMDRTSSNGTSTFRRTTFCGTPNYLAPEVLNREGGHGISVDIWAIGILAYYLAVGKAPFHSKSREEIYERLRTGTYSWPELAPDQNEIPEDLRSLVGTLLVEESTRPTPNYIVRHPFFTRGFIPETLDPLCRSRRPRSARISGLPVDSRTYERLCRESCVGLSSRPAKLGAGGSQQQRERSIILELDEEYRSGVRVAIPLVEGIVYVGRKPAVRVPVISEASREREEAVAPVVPKLREITAVLQTASGSTRGIGPAFPVPVILEDPREGEQAAAPVVSKVREMTGVLQTTSGSKRGVGPAVGVPEILEDFQDKEGPAAPVAPKVRNMTRALQAITNNNKGIGPAVRVPVILEDSQEGEEAAAPMVPKVREMTGVLQATSGNSRGFAALQPPPKRPRRAGVCYE